MKLNSLSSDPIDQLLLPADQDIQSDRHVSAQIVLKYSLVNIVYRPENVDLN